MVLLLAAHLGLNWLAVRAVVLRRFNRQRLGLAFAGWVERGFVEGPVDVARRERILGRGDWLVWDGGRVLGRGLLGAGIGDLVRGGEQGGAETGEKKVLRAESIARSFERGCCVCKATSGAGVGKGQVLMHVLVSRGASGANLLEAWCRALFEAKQLDLAATATAAAATSDDVTSPILERDCGRGRRSSSSGTPQGSPAGISMLDWTRQCGRGSMFEALRSGNRKLS